MIPMLIGRLVGLSTSHLLVDEKKGHGATISAVGCLSHLVNQLSSLWFQESSFEKPQHFFDRDNKKYRETFSFSL